MNDWYRIDLTIYAVTDDSEELEVIADAAMQYIRDNYPVHNVSRDLTATAMDDREVVEYLT